MANLKNSAFEGTIVPINLTTPEILGIKCYKSLVDYPGSIDLSVIVVGGMGSMLGTFIGGMVLGLSQTLGGHFFGDAAQMLVAYLIVLVALTIRPQGLFSR